MTGLMSRNATASAVSSRRSRTQNLAVNDLAEDTVRIVRVMAHDEVLPLSVLWGRFRGGQTPLRSTVLHRFVETALFSLDHESLGEPHNTAPGRGPGLDRLVFSGSRAITAMGGVSLADLGQFEDSGVSTRPLLVSRTRSHGTACKPTSLLVKTARERRKLSSLKPSLARVISFFGKRLDFLGFGQSGLDLAVLQQCGGQVAQKHPAM